MNALTSIKTKSRDARDTFRQRAIEGAERYAAADRSDPFAFSRAMSHLNSGIAGINAQGRDAFYDAEETSETRLLPDGRPYQARVYRGMVRP